MSPSSTVPVYKADGSLYVHASHARYKRLLDCGMVRLTIRKRSGHIARAILFQRLDEAKPIMSPPDGTRYSLQERLEHGKQWILKPILHLPSEDFHTVTTHEAGTRP